MIARDRLGAAEIARILTARINALARDLLPAGHRERAEWRCGSIAGEAGGSLALRLVGDRRGLWHDWATGERGDALDLVRAVLHLDMAEAIAWSRRWLGIEDGPVEPPPPPARAPNPGRNDDPSRWRRLWEPGKPIAGTVATRYLTARGLSYRDPHGDVLRFTPRRARCHPQTGILEYHPALLVLLSEICSGEPCGIINIFLRPDGGDRLRDRKGKTVTGRAGGAAVMLSAWDEPTYGLTVCEGPETGIALLMADLVPVWALGGAGNLAALPMLAGVEALTVAADADDAGRRAAATVAERWSRAGRKAVVITPPAGDWADPRRRP